MTLNTASVTIADYEAQLETENIDPGNTRGLLDPRGIPELSAAVCRKAGARKPGLRLYVENEAVCRETESLIWDNVMTGGLSGEIYLGKVKNRYIHYGKTVFDTGLAVHMPQEYVYVPLDIFREILHNSM